MRRSCEQCGREFDTERSDTRFCGSACRARAWRESPEPPTVLAAVPVPAARSGMAAAVQRALEGAGLTDSWEGATALDLAAAMDAGASGSARAALARELRAVMGEALRGVDEAGSRVGAYRDELAQRRARRAGG